MQTQPYLIASYEVGLEKDVEPWLLPDTAFPTITDAYVWRKRIKRRRGNGFLGRLAEAAFDQYANAVTGVDTSWENSGSPLTNLPVAPTTVTIAIGAYTFTDDGEGNIMDGISTVVGTIDYFSGVISISFAAQGGGPYTVNVVYNYFPCRPVMGLRTWERAAINAEELIAFDTVKANLFNNATKFFNDISFYDTSGAPISWTGTDADFFDSYNYQGGFFATNNTYGFHAQQISNVQIDTPGVGSTQIVFASNVLTTGDIVFIRGVTGTVGTVLNDLSFVVSAATGTTIDLTVTSTGLTYVGGGTAWVPQHTVTGDGIRFYANDSNIDGWVNFNPPINPSNALKGARGLVPYKDHFVALDTIEGDPTNNTTNIRYRNRARWSQNGTVYYTNPVPENQTADALAWRDDIPGRGGFNDAATSEEIIGWQFIRDTLVVFFERSSWALRYTGNEALPFVWVRINVDFGCESQFSIVPFDRGILAVGNRGIITADGNNVSRIDLIIPDTVFEFLNEANSPARVHGMRDYFNELVYWTYVDSSSQSVYPNRLLVYNYRENSYSIFNDSYTCFGNYQPTDGILWNTANFNWEDADFLWNSAQGQSLFPDIVAGTTGGYVMILNQSTLNDTQIGIMGITQSPQAVVTTCGIHNLESGQFIKIVNVNGMTEINDLNTEINVLSNTTFACIDIDSSAFSAYTNGGDIIRINNFDIVTKRMNPFVATGKSVFMTKMDLYTDFIEDGQIAINVYVDENSDTPVNVPAPGDPQIMQTIFPLDHTINGLSVDKTWTRFFCHARGQFIQIEMTMNRDQILDDAINGQEFVLHGMNIHMGPCGRLVSK